MQGAPPINSLTIFDWVLVFVVVVSTLAAFGKGLIRVLLSLLGLVVGILAASWNYVFVAKNFKNWINDNMVAQVVAFLLILVLVMMIFWAIARILQASVKAVGLGFLDRLLGAVFGFVRGLVLGVVAMMAVTAFLPESDVAKNSVLAPYFLDGVHAVSFVVPEHFQDQISAGAKYLSHQSELFRPKR